MSWIDNGLKEIVFSCVRLVLKTGKMDPYLDQISEASQKAQEKIILGVDYAEVIWKWHRANGFDPNVPFSAFFSEYINGIIANAVDAQHMNVPRMIDALVQSIAGASGTSGKFWSDVLKSPQGFAASPLGKGFSATFQVMGDELRPIIRNVIDRIKSDYDQAQAWKAKEVKVN